MAHHARDRHAAAARIEAVLHYSAALGWRQGDNPARWKGHLDHLLPARAKVRRVQHHAALPWSEISAFMVELKQQPGMAAIALRFLILAAARTGEVLGARWNEIDSEAAIWTVPAERMNAGFEHRVPLSTDAFALLDTLRVHGPEPDDFIFLAPRARNAPLSNMAMLVLLRRMKRPDLTVHGFRSTFRDWIGEDTAFPADVAEAALAHTIGNKTRLAYQRGDLLKKRQVMMHAWSNFCEASSLTSEEEVSDSEI